MYEYDDEVLDTFLENQSQLFPENVADTPEAAEEFLEDCMAAHMHLRQPVHNLARSSSQPEHPGGYKRLSAV